MVGLGFLLSHNVDDAPRMSTPKPVPSHHSKVTPLLHLSSRHFQGVISRRPHRDPLIGGGRLPIIARAQPIDCFHHQPSFPRRPSQERRMHQETESVWQQAAPARVPCKPWLLYCTVRREGAAIFLPPQSRHRKRAAPDSSSSGRGRIGTAARVR
jgi:hypothetical protein